MCVHYLFCIVCVCVLRCVCGHILSPALSHTHSLHTEQGSGRFACFLELLGEEVELQGWQHFRGGLDVKSRFTKHIREHKYTCVRTLTGILLSGQS